MPDCADEYRVMAKLGQVRAQVEGSAAQKLTAVYHVPQNFADANDSHTDLNSEN
jgi:hypothetical protein